MILFVDNGNVARSQMAEYFYKSMSSEHKVMSVGTEVYEKSGDKLHPYVIQVMKEEKIDLSHAQRKQANGIHYRAARHIVWMSNERFPENQSEENVTYWQVADPKGKDLDFFRKTRDEIKGLVLVNTNDHRNDLAGLILCTCIKLLTELHDVHTLCTQSRSYRRGRICSSSSDLKFY